MSLLPTKNRGAAAPLVRISLFALLAVLAAGLTACGGKDDRMVPDREFSMNVVMVPDDWPQEEDWPEEPMERRAREEVWAQYGTPDFVRRVYTWDDRIVREVELSEGYVMPGRRPRPLTEWVFMDEDVRVQFDGPKWDELPLRDDLRVVCEYGDPMAIKQFDKGDYTQTSFYYYNIGKEFVFIDGNQIDERMFSAAPGAERLRE